MERDDPNAIAKKKRRSGGRHRKQPTGDVTLSGKKKTKKHRADLPSEGESIGVMTASSSLPMMVPNSDPDDRNKVEGMMDTMVQRVRTVLRRKSGNESDEEEIGVPVARFRNGAGRDVIRRRSHSFNQADFLRSLDIEISDSDELRQFTATLGSRLERHTKVSLLKECRRDESALEVTGTDRSTFSVAIRSESDSSEELLSLSPGSHILSSSPPLVSYLTRSSSLSSSSIPNAQSVNGTLPALNPSLKDHRVNFNVGGAHFETFASTLAKYPDTLLGAMFNPRNHSLRHEPDNLDEEHFFDRDPTCFAVILNFYRTGSLIVPPQIPLDLIRSECQFFGIDMAVGLGDSNKRISMELNKMDYKNQIFDAGIYKKMTRHKLLTDHYATLLEILNKFSRCIEKTAVQGRSAVDVHFFSPLHYTKSASRNTFNVISKKEIRELIIEMFEEKHFTVTIEEEYSKIKSTNIIGLDDQVTNYNDPKFFSFTIAW